MSSNGNQVPLVPNQRGSGAYPRASTPHRPVECYLPGGTAGAAYIPNTTGGAQPPTQATHRAQTTPQPSAPPASQQDISKTNLAGHSYVSPNQTPQPRQHFQYRPTQHGTRPNSHPRQQQSFIPSVTATTTGPVVYPTIIYQHTPMSMQTYQQQRSSTSGYYPPYMGPYIGYNTPPSHTPPPYYYPSNNPQLPTPSIQANNPSTRNNPTTLVGPQGTPATATPPTATLTHAPSHMHSPIPGIRPLVPKRQSHRLPIIDPVTQQDIFSEFYSNDHRLPIIDPVTHQDIFCTNDNFLCGETNNDRQTPQLEHNVNQEFTRMVNEAANLPSCDSALKSNYVTKNVEPLMSSTTNSVQIQTNAIMSVNNNIVKSDLLAISETKNLGPDVAVVASETPIVSAISDSPVIVPKLPLSNKQLQKNSDQNVVLDTNKNISHNKQCKENVPQEEGVDKPIDSIVMALSVATTTSITNVPAVTATLTPSPLPALTATTHVTQMPIPTPVPLPQPQRIREPRERTNKLEDKEKSKYRELQEKEILSAAGKCNGSTTVVISSVDSLSEVINRPTSPINQTTELEPVKKQDLTKEAPLAPEPEVPTTVETNIESEPVEPFPTATQLLSASIEKAATDQQFVSPKAIEINEASSGIEAQAKLTQSISSVLRSNQPESKMKDINLNNKTTDSDAANGNPNEVTKMETVVKEDINKNDKVVKSPKNTNKKSNKMTSNEINVNETESPENGKNETDKVVTNLEKDESQPDVTIQDKSIEESIKTEQKLSTPTFVPKYRYTEEQWSPLNKSGKKCYDIGLLKQIKDDPLSKNKPNAPLLEACNVIRTSPMQEPLPFTPISRPMNDSLFPPFAKSGMGSRNNNPREVKKDVRNMTQSVKGSVKLNQIPNAANQPKHIYVSLSLREEVKLNEVDSAWKPTRFRKENLDEEELKTQELYKKFRGILNKLTPQKFDTLLDKVKTLEINNQKRLEGVIDLVFEKAIDEPNFSEAYATMCNKLSMLKVPADNATPEHFVNFRALIINKCQKQFETAQVDEQVLKLEKELADCSDPTKKKELQLMLDEENRRLRMRSVGNVRFIGELYKLKMLTSKIMDYCMKYLIDKIEEEKLECLCKLLTTIGEQVENESSGQLDSIFKKMQDIVDRKSNKISSRVRFMLQDVIELRKRKWVAKTVIDSQPKMMDQIQKEAEQQQRHIELINAVPIGGGFRRDEGGKGKRGDSRRQNSNNSIMDNTSKSTKTTNFPFDTSKFKAVSGTQKNLNNIKLAPPNSAWTHGSGTKTIAQASSNSMFSLTKNTYSILDTVQTDPSSLRANRDITPTYHSKGASIERSTFMTRGDISGGGVNRPGSVGVTRSNSSTRSNIVTTSLPTLTSNTSAPISSPLPQEPLPDSKKKLVKSMVDLRFINPDDNEFVAEVNQYYLPQHHAALVAEILNLTFEKSLKEYEMIAKSLLHLVSTGTISPENFVTGLKEMITVAPEHYIDVPMLYDNLGKLIALQLEKKHITFVQIFNLCDTIIAKNHGPLILKAIFKKLKESMGPSFVKSKWQESGLELKQWMDENQVTKWLEENKLEFLEGDTKVSEETNKIMTPPETQSKLIQLMNAGESYDCIKGWLQDNFGKSTNEDWFMRTLIQAICKYALHGAEGRDVPHFNQERMNKYARLINEFGESIESREANCLFGVQQLIRTLEHPKGLTLEIFQYLHEQYLITCNGFIAWEGSEKEPEGKGVMMMALTSFFTNIKEADNEDSCSED